MSRFLFGLAYAVGIPILALALVLSSTALVVFGPAAFDGGVGAFLAGLVTVAAYVGVLFSQMRYETGLVFLGGFFTLIPGLFFIDNAVEERALLDRGELVTCTVVDVTRRYHFTENLAHVSYDHHLACPRPDVTAITSGHQVAQEGEPVMVLFDRAGRLAPRLADSIADTGTQAKLGAAGLGIGIVLRVLGEFSIGSGLAPSPLRGRKWQKEQRRIRRLRRSPARGDARVRWLLPYVDFRRDQSRPPASVAQVDRHTDNGAGDWTVLPVKAHRCRVSLWAAPPAVGNVVRGLSDLYLASDRKWEVENVVVSDEEPVAAATAELKRWHEAANAYLTELAAVNADLWQFWVDRGQRLGVSWGRSALLRAWQDHVRSGCERLARASDAYRPIFEEINAAIATTALARQDLAARKQRLREWEERRLWYLQPAADGAMTIVRSDVSGERPPGTDLHTLRGAYAAAKAHHDEHLVPVDWDSASLSACSDELAAMSAAHPPVGTTRSGLPMARPSPVSFSAWFLQSFWFSHDQLSDRQEIERQRRLRDQAKARGPVRPRSAGGSWPTDPGSGDYIIGDHSGGDYGDSSYGGDYGGGGYAGGYSGGGGY